MGNPVVHFELIGPDPARLRDFYSQLFGWDAPAGAPVAERVSTPTEYSFITPSNQAPAAAGGIGGGPGYDNHAIFYVGVSNVAEALVSAEALGAAIVMPPQRNEGAQVTVAHFRDRPATWSASLDPPDRSSTRRCPKWPSGSGPEQ
jgi:predicted enzyme related to lactoylglutathione lyase